MLSKSDQRKIAAILKDRRLCTGPGDGESEVCSIAAINLALSGELTDAVPDCMSLVVGRWIIAVQDAMPDAMRNSEEWRRLLPLAAGTGRGKEQQRLDRIMSWLWETVLPSLLPVAREHGFGAGWETMLTERTPRAARAAWAAARAAAADAAVYAACNAGAAARNADYAARLRSCAANAAAYAADAADAASAARAARALANAARAAAGADGAAAYEAAWEKFDPAGLLAELVEV